MTFTPHPKQGSKPKKPGAFKSNSKAARVTMVPPIPLKVGDKVTGAIEGTIVAVSGQTKGAMIQAMLLKGATSKELEAATGWKPHSVRGYLGTLRKAKVNVVSHKTKGEPTIYRIEKPSDEVI